MKKYNGLTLLELVITLLIIVILAGITQASMDTFVQKNRVKTTIFTLNQSLFLARNHSINTLNYITVCPLSENSCANDWQLGIDTFIDYNQDKQLNENDQLLLTSGKLNDNGILKFPENAITFTPEGQILGTSASLLFRYCSGEQKGAIRVNYTGQTEILGNTSFTSCAD